ncbi:MAG: 30S ribosomal protein S18 [Rickettsiaceae bacterium H1]|nr:30S ribosomal protein S18 [Rickettsiaceae bacterium H1]
MLFSMQHSFQDKKPCPLCRYEKLSIDYKDVSLLKTFISDGGRMLPRRLTQVCAKHQRILVKAIKRARFMALIPFCD